MRTFIKDDNTTYIRTMKPNHFVIIVMEFTSPLIQLFHIVIPQFDFIIIFLFYSVVLFLLQQ